MNFFGKAINFLKESKSELSKVVWPKKTEVLRYTTIVILTIAIASVVVFAFDFLLVKLVQFFVIK